MQHERFPHPGFNQQQTKRLRLQCVKWFNFCGYNKLDYSREVYGRELIGLRQFGIAEVTGELPVPFIEASTLLGPFSSPSKTERRGYSGS